MSNSELITDHGEESIRPLLFGTWNVEWATASARVGQRIKQIIEKLDPDVFVLTEGSADLLPANGFVIDGGTDWGYSLRNPAHRKVVVWSREPWTEIDQIGSSELPSGRFVVGTTVTKVGSVRVMGVCIPWQAAHTSTGNQNRKNWEDHETYLTHLAPLLSTGLDPLIVAGDFNQRIPRGRQPIRIFEALERTFKGFAVSTTLDDAPALIDHIVHSQNLQSRGLYVIPAEDEQGKLSDHRGAIVRLTKSKWDL
jgi:endonuclease/exonuclease/phosphatase family metal-dependent hydrolase